MSGWNQWVKWVAPFSMAQSFMVAATTSATRGSSGSPPVDGAHQALEDLLGQALAHDATGEDIGGEDLVNGGGLGGRHAVRAPVGRFVGWAVGRIVAGQVLANEPDRGYHYP